MCKIQQEVKKVAKNSDVADAATSFGMSAQVLAQLVIGKGMSPAETRASQAVVQKAGGGKTLKALRQAHG